MMIFFQALFFPKQLFGQENDLSVFFFLIENEVFQGLKFRLETAAGFYMHSHVQQRLCVLVSLSSWQLF